jgi:hypothetical protein
MSWTFSHGELSQSFVDCGLSHLRRHRINQGRDWVSFRRTGGAALSEVPLLEPFEPVTILHGGEPWFSGLVTETPSLGTAAAESCDYRISGPWWYLESIIYQQPWNLISDPTDPESGLATTHKSHIILGQSVSGSPISIRQQLGDILAYAVASGAQLAYDLGEGDLDFSFPYDECKDLSCAEALQRVLRWVPDARIHFDYSATPPVLCLLRRGDAEKISIPLGPALRSLSITPRHDLRLAGVIIKYERSHSADGYVWNTLETDCYPEEISEQQPRLLVLTVELAGSRSHSLMQRVRAESIHLSSPAWWKSHLPALGGIDDGDLTILESSRDSELPRELVDGGIADWMGVEVEADIARAKISYTQSGMVVQEQEVAVKLKATDAQSRTYSRLASYSPEESTPQGLARLLFESFSQSPHGGELRWEGGEIPAIPMGALINVTGGQPQWAEMDGEIQEIFEEVDSGSLRLRIGPPSHLGLQQLVQLTRSNRRREAARSGLARLSGEPAGTKIDQPAHLPTENSHSGASVFSKILLRQGDDPERQIILDADAIGLGGLTIQCREEDVVENGTLRKRLVLASQPYAAAEEE